MDNKLYLGKITSTHGIKGELKIKSDFEYKTRVFKKGFNIFVNDEIFEITSYRAHKQFDMITINNILDINKVIEYVGSDVYIKREDLNLKDSEYLLSDLIDFSVYDEEVLLGKVKEIRYNINNKFLFVTGESDFYIPLIDAYIISVNTNAKKIITNNGKDLII